MKKTYYLYTKGRYNWLYRQGAWAYILKCPETGEVIKKCGKVDDTSRNQTELVAVINGLMQIPADADIILHSENEYILDCIQKKRWKAWRALRPVLNFRMLNASWIPDCPELFECSKKVWEMSLFRRDRPFRGNRFRDVR